MASWSPRVSTRCFLRSGRWQGVGSGPLFEAIFEVRGGRAAPERLALVPHGEGVSASGKRGCVSCEQRMSEPAHRSRRRRGNTSGAQG